MFRYGLYASGIIAFTLLIFLIFILKKDPSPYARDAETLSHGKDLFATHCASCHALEADGMGPRLGGITQLLGREQLIGFIKDPEAVINSGDERATALRERYNQIMPAYHWMDDMAIHSILSYIDDQSRQFQIKALTIRQVDQQLTGVSGNILPPATRSDLKIELEEYCHITRLDYSTPDLGIVTLRPHPSGDGRLYVSDQGGILYEVSNGKASVFLDLRSHVRDFSIGPGLATGLGSFDFHPDFLNNGLIYITHAEKYHNQRADYRISDSVMAEVQWILGEWKMEDVKDRIFKGTRRELLRLHAPTFGHGAQDIGFIPDLPREHPDYGLLYFGFGDGGSNNIRMGELGHHRKSFLGTILRIDPQGNNSINGKYGIPPDNPFANDSDSGTVREIWAYGFRNPHRMSWDPSNPKRMFVTDIGEANIEEINIVEKGGDYGWPSREGNFGIAPKKDLKTVFPLQPSDLDLYEKPFVQYDHTIGYAISGGFVYDGDLELLRDKYIFGDIVNGKLFYVNIDPALRDSTIYEMTVVGNGMETDLRRMSGIKRLHLRIAYDRLAKQLYVITKADGKIRRVTRAYR